MDIPGMIQMDYSISRADNFQAVSLPIIRAVRPTWRQDNMKFKLFTDGITNKLIGCRLDSDEECADLVLVRLYGEKTETIIDRDMEMLTMFVMNAAGCSRPLFCRFNNGISYGFTPGFCLNAETVREEHIGAMVAREMVKVGAIDPISYSSGLSVKTMDKMTLLSDRKPSTFGKLRTFLAEMADTLPDPEKNEKLHSQLPSKTEITEEMNQLEKELDCLGSPVVFCHNDLLLNNIVYNQKEDRCYFIDYEYGSFNYQAFEIGNHFNEWAGVDEVDYNRYPDKTTQLVWLRTYLEFYKAQQNELVTTPTQKEVETLYVQVNKFSLASNLFWGTWALVQARYSTIDFDFLEYGKIRLDQYFKMKEEFLSLKLPE